MGFVRSHPDGSSEYSGLGRTVVVRPDGSITVKQGDTLGIYSSAIYGNFDNMARNFGRGNATGVKSFATLGANIDLIFAGETIYQMARHRTQGNSNSGAAPVSEEEALRLIEEVLKTDFGLTGAKLKETAKFVRYAGLSMRKVSIAAIPAEFAVLAAEIGGVLTAGGATSVLLGELILGAALGAGVLGALLVPVGAIIGLVLARNINTTNNALRGVVYAMVAWSFNQPRPGLPAQIRYNLLTSHLADEKAELQRTEAAWLQAVNATYASMDMEPAKQQVNKELLQAAYRFAGNDSAKALATLLMDKMADRSFSRKLEKENFLSPTPDYPKA